MANKLVSIWGSSGSGKTVTAIKIAKVLGELKQNVVIVGCDEQIPLLPLLLPSSLDLPSLGDALTQDQLTQTEVLRHCVPFGKNPYINLMGYRLKENFLSYPEYSIQRAAELLSHLSRLSDIVLIDCSSNLDNVLTAAALKQSDVTFRVTNPDPKSLIYIQSASPLLLRDSSYKYNQQINIVNNILPSQDTQPAMEVIGDISYTLPNVPALKTQYDCMELLDSLTGKTSRQYEMEIKKLVKEVITNEPEHGIIRRRKARSFLSEAARSDA